MSQRRNLFGFELGGGNDTRFEDWDDNDIKEGENLSTVDLTKVVTSSAPLTAGQFVYTASDGRIVTDGDLRLDAINDSIEIGSTLNLALGGQTCLISRDGSNQMVLTGNSGPCLTLNNGVTTIASGGRLDFQTTTTSISRDGNGALVLTGNGDSILGLAGTHISMSAASAERARIQNGKAYFRGELHVHGQTINGSNQPGIRIIPDSSDINSSPQIRFCEDDSGDFGARIQFRGDNNALQFERINTGTFTSIFDIPRDSNALRPGTDNSTTLGASGRRWSVVHAASGTINTSDANEKTDISASLGLSFINELNPVRYRFNYGVRMHEGLIAQEVKTVLDDYKIDSGMYIDPAQSGEEGLKGLRYCEFIGPMIKAIQELSATVTSQATTIADLAARIEVLEQV